MLNRRSRRSLLSLAVILLGAAAAPGQPVRFDGHSVVRVVTQNAAQLDLLLSMTDDVWSESTGVGPLDVRVTPEQLTQLRISGLPYEILIDDIQPRIDAQLAPSAGGIAGEAPWDAYMPYADVLTYMNSLVAMRPDLAQLVTIGQTLEGRDIVGLRITGPGSGKPGILYHGCEHAREWITVPTTLYYADQLIRTYDTDADVHALVDRIEWFIVPVFNVDGYLFTWSDSRLWRKNRRDNGDGTFGVDINRNWGYFWGGEGSSAATNNETYRGSAPFSEPETTAMSTFLSSHPQIVAYCDIHSYSQLILYPWGYTPTALPDQATYDLVGAQLAARIAEVSGYTYTPGGIYNLLYPASGVSVDWAHGVLGIQAYSYELRDTGQFGFTLPPDQILPTCLEMFPSLLYLGDTTTAVVRIVYPDGLPTHFLPGVVNDVVVQVIDGTQSVDPASVTAYYRTSPDGAFSLATATQIGADRFAIHFPPRSCGAATEFYVSAGGQSGGGAVSPPGAPGSTHSVVIGTPTIVWADDFETNQGWTGSAAPGSNGAWVRVDPVRAAQNTRTTQPEDDHTASPGVLCWITANGVPGGQSGAADVDLGPVTLTSPSLALAGLDPTISFYRWFYNDDGDDRLTIEVSNDDGANWTPVKIVAHDPAWVLQGFRVADFLIPTNTVRVRFITADNPNNSVTEAGLDDFTVTAFTCVDAALHGDANCDGSIDFFDIDPFLLALFDFAAWQTAFPECVLANVDVNADQAVDFFDIDPFLDVLF